jgi:hypothetical protein
VVALGQSRSATSADVLDQLDLGRREAAVRIVALHPGAVASSVTRAFTDGQVNS